MKPSYRHTSRCGVNGKVKFRTKRKAQRAIETVRAAHGVNLRAYKCPFCEGWHFTSQSKN